MPWWAILLVVYVGISLILFARMLKENLRQRDENKLEIHTSYIFILSLYDGFSWPWYLVRYGVEDFFKEIIKGG